MSIYNIISEDIKENNYNNIATITVGVVTDINDPDKLGRVKVKLLNRTTSDCETDYIRVMQCPKMLWLDKHKPEKRIIE